MLCNGTPEPNQRNRARWAVTRCRITCAFVSKRTVAHVNDPLFVHHTNVRVCAHFPVSESPFGGWKDEIEAKPIRKRNKKNKCGTVPVYPAKTNCYSCRPKRRVVLLFSNNHNLYYAMVYSKYYNTH